MSRVTRDANFLDNNKPDRCYLSPSGPYVRIAVVLLLSGRQMTSSAHSENCISESFQIECNVIVVTLFFSDLKRIIDLFR